MPKHYRTVQIRMADLEWLISEIREQTFPIHYNPRFQRILLALKKG